MNPGQELSPRYSAIEDRGRIYLAIFRELKQRLGEDEAISIMRSASRAHGVEVGQSIKHLAPNDFQGLLKEYFLGPDEGATFNPEVIELNGERLKVQIRTCPLKDGWLAAGCSEDEVCTLLQCATGFDHGVMETAGFDYELQVWKPGQTGCCRTTIKAR